jgi:DNA (cytosine-5)-methyltransferase 1
LRPLTVGSLFSGIGGLDLGLERAGMRVIWQSEIDPYASAVLKKHWPSVPNLGDITKIDWSSVERPDLVCGGFPCQPFSSASHRRRKGVRSDGNLWPKMLGAIQELKPTWVLGENVIGLQRDALEIVVSDLETIGYEVAPTLEIPAAAFGHDHWRARNWIIGYTNSNGESGRTVDAEASRLPTRDREPGEMGAKDGVPARMDRLRCLGNAVVPQVAEWIGRQIIKTEAE